MNQKLSPRRRALSLLLALTLVLGLLPGSAFAAETGAASSGHWASSYLNQLVEWGFIRADQAQNPDRELTRADFMSIVNRAYGYHETGPTPFEDITEYDWFYDDVRIAYNAGYIEGTSPTTASPNDTLNRETAATILGRNMMLQESPGEMTDFSDARDVSNWARGTIKSSMEHYLVTGYDDGTFRPKKSMTWGEISAMVSRTIGTPLQDAGDYSLGGVFGNVTITAPGVTLRDTVVSGDLYVSGGVGLGGVKLENVTVLGRIIASGTGASEGGASILLRNVSADELLIDNLRGNEVSVQADGITEIGKTTVRTSAYIQDNTPEGMGLHTISLEGAYYGEDEEPPEGWTPAKLTLAGRIEEVINRTPDTTVHVAKGTVSKLTVDETAEGSHVIIDRGAVVKDLVLDAGIDVTGQGDVTRLEVNAPGANVSMLPDEIVIRPGITAMVAGQEMDSASAEEFLLDPMILAGYPKAQDIAPTSLEAVFATNKQGRIYWAVSAITDGSIGAEDLLKPPSYGNKAVRWGTVDVPRGNEEVTTTITGLTSNGEYYLSAVLEDARGQLSPVKVISFSTPDNTIPAFNTGYPYMSKVSPTDSVVVVSVTKDCKLYYALLPEGAIAPTEAEFRANAVAGALGFGVRDVQKNVEDAFRVNDQILEEKKNYVLYLWLVDADGVNKSAVTSLTFTTDDETPPEFIVDPTVNAVQATSVTLNFRLNEDGIVYWVAVPAGTVYPKPEPGTDYETAPLTSAYAILQVVSGMNIGTEGKAGRVNAVENVDGLITVAGLQPEKSYDFYYVAKDNAGPDRNYSITVKKITINTLDTNGPIFTQRFSKYSGLDDMVDPLADTDIYLDVNENIRYTGEGGGRGFLELYSDIKAAASERERIVAVNRLAGNLFGSIKLHKVSIQDNSEEQVFETHSTNEPFTDAMTIDYTQATVEAHDGGIRITFPASGLHLENGAEYYFTIENITDTSNNQNPVVPTRIDFKRNPDPADDAGHSVWPFVVEFASVNLSSPGVAATDGPIRYDYDASKDDDPTNNDDKYARVDFNFRMTPVSTSTVGDALSYDILLWCDNLVTYDLYYRVVSATGERLDTKGVYSPTYAGSDETDAPYHYLLPRLGKDSSGNARVQGQGDENGWIYLGNSGDVNGTKDNWSGRSVNKYFNGTGSTSFPKLKNLREDLRYEFVIELQTLGVGEQDDYTLWTGEVTMRVNVAAGQSSNLENLAGGLTEENWERAKQQGLSTGAKSIGKWYDENNQLTDTQILTRIFTNSGLPEFYGGAPTFTDVTSSSLTINLRLSSPGWVYYAIGKADGGDGTPQITTTRNVLSVDEGDPLNPPHYVDLNKTQMYVTLDDIVPPPANGGEAMPGWMKGVPSGTSEDALGAAVDNPALNNQVNRPTSRSIYSPDSWAETSDAITGMYYCGGTSMQRVPINDSRLEPDTDYFVYFVLKGSADPLSHVYIYHFRTDVVSKPQITPNGKNDGSVDIQTHVTSQYVYRVYSLADIQSAGVSILAQPFVGTEANDYKDGFVDDTGVYIPANQELPDYYKTKTSDIFTITTGEGDDAKTEPAPYSVLDALIDAYAYNTAYNGSANKENAYFPSNQSEGYLAYSHGASVFDIYANNTAREIIDAVVRTARGTGDKIAEWFTFGDGDIGEPYGTANEVLDKIEEGTKYVILIVAQSPEMNSQNASASDAERDGFRAFSPIQKSAGDPPDLVAAYPNNLVSTNAPTYTWFTGTIILEFDKELFDSDGRTDPSDSGLTGAQFVQGITENVTATPVTSVEGTATKTYRINFTLNLASTTKTVVFSSPRFYNASGAVAPETLRLELKREPETITFTDSEGNTSSYQRIWIRLYVTWGTGAPILVDEMYYDEGRPAGASTVSLSSLKLVNSTTKATLGSAYPNNYDYKIELDLSDPSKSAAKVEAVLTAVSGADTSGIGIEWTADASGAAALTASGTGKKQVQITAQKIGTTVITARSQDAKGLTKRILVVVKSSGLNITMTTPQTAYIKWDAAAKKCTLDRSGTNKTPSATFSVTVANGLDSGAKITASATMNGKATNAVKCTVSGNTIQIQDQGSTKGTVTVTVKVESKDGLELSKGTFTVELTGSVMSTPVSGAKNPY